MFLVVAQSLAWSIQHENQQVARVAHVRHYFHVQLAQVDPKLRKARAAPDRSSRAELADSLPEGDLEAVSTVLVEHGLSPSIANDGDHPSLYLAVAHSNPLFMAVDVGTHHRACGIKGRLYYVHLAGFWVRVPDRLTESIETRQGIRHFVNSLDHSFVLFSCDSTLAWCTVVEGANEWLQILTVSLDDGRIHRTIDVPLPSPGGEYVAVGSPPDLYVEGFVEIRESVNFTVLDQWDSSKLRAFCGKDLFGGIPFVGATNMSWESVDRMRLEIQCGEQSVDARIQRSATGDWMLFTKEPSQLPPPN